jgi:rSAM/selenodomain-associated transferase 2
MMRLSIIIPTYNEAANIGDLVRYLRDKGGEHVQEVIVVDGGSDDGTMDLAAQAGAQVVYCPQRCRAVQLHLGASRARGGLYYFVHADTVPPATFATDALQALQEGYLYGNYASTFVGKAQMGVNGRMTQRDWLVTRGGGDQTLFITKEFYQELGGFDHRFVLMEDFDLVRRARRRARMCILQASVYVSTRKYLRNSYLRVSLANLIVYVSFLLRVPPRGLALMYRKLLRPIPKVPGQPSMVQQVQQEQHLPTHA